MLCYKDMTFCDNGGCDQKDCERHYSRTEGAIDANLPVCWGKFWECEKYF